MKLPTILQHFPEPTLLVLTDEQEAKFLLAGGDSLEHLDSIALPRERVGDKEGMTKTPGGYISGHDLSDTHDTPRKKKFADEVADRIRSLIRQGHATSIRLISPPEMLHLIDERLPHDLQDRVLSRLPKDLMKMSDVEVLTRIFEKPE